MNRADENKIDGGRWHNVRMDTVVIVIVDIDGYYQVQ